MCEHRIQLVKDLQNSDCWVINTDKTEPYYTPSRDASVDNVEEQCIEFLRKREFLLNLKATKSNDIVNMMEILNNELLRFQQDFSINNKR